MMARLAGKRILVVEDEYFIASDLARALASEGAIVVGPTGDVRTGLGLANDEPLDGALLDVNLGGDYIYPIADALVARGVPWMFVTGYDGWSLPEAYRQATVVTKPFSMAIVVDSIARLLAEEPRR